MIKDDIYDIFLAFLCMSSDPPDCPVSQSSTELFSIRKERDNEKFSIYGLKDLYEDRGLQYGSFIVQRFR